MLKLEETKAFKKCLKKYQHKKVVALLINDDPIPVKYKDHLSTRQKLALTYFFTSPLVGEVSQSNALAGRGVFK
jgi:hypothetical protein